MSGSFSASIILRSSSVDSPSKVSSISLSVSRASSRTARVKFEKQEGGRGLFASVYQMAGNKEGESLGAAVKKPECIVTGGAATIRVSYMGKEYFVCCTGCRDEFNATPEKFETSR